MRLTFPPGLAGIRTPADRDIIHHRTVQQGQGAGYELRIEPPAVDEEIVLLVLGDSGDSDRFPEGTSPQEAVAREMARDGGPESATPASAVLHTGDVIYMAGERRLYEACFLRPYREFLMPASVRTNLVFRLPFLAVPGNHDYYDVSGWALHLATLPFVGSGLRAAAGRLLDLTMPREGSGMGASYQEAFIDVDADTTDGRTHPYLPGERTRLPNRYYRTQLGPVDLFALDSNTLDAPPPHAEPRAVRREAGERLQALRAEGPALVQRAERARQALEAWERARCQDLAESRPGGEILEAVRAAVRSVGTEADAFDLTLEGVAERISPGETRQTLEAVRRSHRDYTRRWLRRYQPLEAATNPDQFWEPYLDELEEFDDLAVTWRDVLETAQGALGEIPASNAKEDCERQRSALLEALLTWCEVRLVERVPEAIQTELHVVGELQLDHQRALALAGRRARYRPEDFDSEQLQWLDAALADASRQRPENWRILLLHHPLYTAIGNHSEGHDILGIRANLEAIIRNRVHLVLAGHSHGFEWLESQALPNTCLLVTGGGGQVTLRRSILQSRRGLARLQRQSLVAAGLRRYLYFGAGPLAVNGRALPVYHYLRLRITADRIEITPVGVHPTGNGYERSEPVRVEYTPDVRLSLRPELRDLRHITLTRDGSAVATWG